ncbi:hypothetical protein TB2_044539 [Malus domestica]
MSSKFTSTPLLPTSKLMKRASNLYILIKTCPHSVQAVFQSEKGSDEELQASSRNHVEPDRVSRRETPIRIEKKPEPVRPPPVRSSLVPAPVSSSNPLSNPALAQSSPLRTNSQLNRSGVKPLKQLKPKAKDPNKRDMSMEEKQKLGIVLQSLPQEKMEQVVQIIGKRNGHLKQDGDEIELDIEAVDTEILWELDQLVTNWKKIVSKIKWQALMGNTNSNSNSKLVLEEHSSDVSTSLHPNSKLLHIVYRCQKEKDDEGINKRNFTDKHKHAKGIKKEVITSQEDTWRFGKPVDPSSLTYAISY